MTAESPLGRLRGPRPPIAWDAPPKAPKEAQTDRVWIGADPHGLGFEVAVAAWASDSAPTLEALRALHAGRLKSRAVPLCVALHDDRGRSWVLGPLAAAPALGPLPEAQAARLLQAALAEPTASAARARILQARDAFESAEIPGFDSQGLFAIRELTWGVPRRQDWSAASERSRALLAAAPRNSDLVRGLGFETRDIPGNALLLTVGDAPPRAVAIMLKDDEAFDAESPRFGRSPIYHGLDIARRNNVRWLIVVRGSQIRLYPTAPDVGVGRRGATQTYFGLDLALLDDAHAGYLTLAFGGDALRPGGSADEILDASRDYAVSLGERLRDRIYADVIDRLSVAVANAVAAGGSLDDDRLAFSYRLTLRVLFRLLFQAYAEDTHLLPLHRNDRYTRASLKELARDFSAHPERQNDPNSTSLWDGLQQVWRVIDKGDSAWGIPAYNGGLFGADPDLHPDGAVIAGLRLSNDTIGPALAGLLVDRGPDGERGPVDFRSLDVRDFGTIYEGLLESGISLAPEDLTLDASDAWRPAKPGETVRVRVGDPYFHSKSGDRKATGSYFTRPFAVEHLLERALDPALDAHLDAVAALVGKGDQVGAARRFFDFRVADLAMGSGHFLVAAIGHIEAKFGAFLERTPVPGVERELIELADAAVKSLAQVGIETTDIDRSALLGRQIARRCVYGLDINAIAVELARLAIWVRTFVPGLPMSSLDHQLVCGNSLTGIGTIEEAVEALDPGARSGALTFSGAAIRQALEGARRLLEDAAALKESTSEEAHTAQEAARRARDVAQPARLLFDAAVAARLGVLPFPADFDVEGIGRAASNPSVQNSLTEYAPIHFPIQFPEVFLREQAGFDVLIGNPPWDKLRHEPTQFWAVRSPGLLASPDRDAAIEKLRADRPDEAVAEERERTSREHLREYVRVAYRYQGSGHYDFAKLFAERNLQLVAPRGSLGIVLPGGWSRLPGWEDLRRQYLGVGQVTVVQAENHGGFMFDGIDGRLTIVLVAVLRGAEGPLLVASGVSSMATFAAAMNSVVELPVGQLEAMSESAQIPWFGSVSGARVFMKIGSHPRLAGGVGWISGEPDTRWDFSGSGRDSDVAVEEPRPGAWRVLMTRHVDAYSIREDGYRRWIPPERLPGLARRGVRPARAGGFDLDETHPSIVYRFPSRSTDSRTLIATALPASGYLYSTGYAHGLKTTGRVEDTLALLGLINSIPTDWWARRLVDRHVGAGIVRALPLPAWDERARRLVASSVGSLLAQAGVRTLPGGHPVADAPSGDPDWTLSMVDAYVALGYGLDREDLLLIMEDFSERRDGLPQGRRTLILRAWDEICGA